MTTQNQNCSVKEGSLKFKIDRTSHDDWRKTTFAPGEILPVCGKCADFELKCAEDYYYCLMRSMAQVAAWDKQGRFDDYIDAFVPPHKVEAASAAAAAPRTNVDPTKRREKAAKDTGRFVDKAIDFIQNVAPQLFRDSLREGTYLQKFKDGLSFCSSFFPEVSEYQGTDENFQAMVHSNLQVDNAFFWRNEKGHMDCCVLSHGCLFLQNI